MATALTTPWRQPQGERVIIIVGPMPCQGCSTHLFFVRLPPGRLDRVLRKPPRHGLCSADGRLHVCPAAPGAPVRQPSWHSEGLGTAAAAPLDAATAATA